MLYFCHVLFTFCPLMLDEFIALSNTEKWAGILTDVHKLFDKKQYTKGKLLWLRQFPQFHGEGRWDCFGSEQDLFFCMMSVFITSVYTTTCSNASTCSMPVTVKQCTSICLSWPDNCHITFQDSIDEWYKNCHKPSRCRSVHVETGASCTGEVSTSRRQPVMADPPMVYFEVDLCPLSRLPTEIKLPNGKRYSLFCITYGNEGHFVGCISIPKTGWYLYN